MTCLAMRTLVAVALLLACSSQRESRQQPPPVRPVVSDAMVSAARDARLSPCVVRVALSPGQVTLSGGGLTGSDVTALRKLPNDCITVLVPDDAVSFGVVVKTVRSIVQQGVQGLRLGAPAGQWMSMDLARVRTLWDAEPAATLIAAIKEEGPRLGADNASIVEQVASTLARARQDEAIGKQSSDRGLFEAIAQIVGLRRATAPVAIDLLEQVVMPVLHIDPNTEVSWQPSDDAAKPQTGVELFERFVEGARKGGPVKGLLGAIPDADLRTPYPDGQWGNVVDGDWVIVASAALASRLTSFDAQKLDAQYERFLERLKVRDDDRVLVDVSRRALADLAALVATAGQNKDALVFRTLPAPRVMPSEASDEAALPTVLITQADIVVKGERSRRPVLSSLSDRSPRQIVIEADRALAYGRIRAVAAAIGTPGSVTLVLRAR